MKKFTLWILVAVCLVVSVEPVFAAYGNYSSNESIQTKIDRFNAKADALKGEVDKLANNIASYNKPTFEAQLTKKERNASPIMWNRVWAKGKTIVFGAAKKDKKFWAYFLKTSDPELVFANGIRVGASAQVLERYFGDTLKNIGYNVGQNIIVCGPYYGESDVMEATVSIVCLNGVITEIHYDISAGYGVEGTLSKKAIDFANTQARKIGFSGIRSGLTAVGR